jgi:hypothetical protein
MYFRNFQRLKPDRRAMPPRTTTNRMQVMYIVPISLPSATIDPRPYFPTVNAIAPNAASGARRMIIPTTENTPCVNESRKSTTGLPRGPMWERATPNIVAKTRICRMSFLASASTMLVGTRFSMKSMKPVGLAAVAV